MIQRTIQQTLAESSLYAAAVV